MAKISSGSIEQIKARADVLDVVSEVVQMRQRGRNYFGLCPFHEEKTPSFSVNPALGIFHCFGCGKGGNAVTFVMEYEKIDYIEALKKLADRYGIELEWEGGEDTRKGEIALIYELHELAAQIYHGLLFAERGRNAREYLRERGFEEALLRQFRIGYVPDEWDMLFRQIDLTRFTPGILEKSGLFIRREGNNFYDRFRNRVIFPIVNLSGRVIAFGGRTLDPQEETKYLNSPETPIYFKSGVFYGLNVAKDAIQKTGEALLVEGYTDFLRLYSQGFTNAVAGSGTALTFHHARLLRRFTTRILLCYDGDEAGQKATERAGFLLQKEGLDVRAIRLPIEEDPDTFLKNHKRAELEELAKSAPDFITYYLARNAEHLQSPAGKTLFIERLAEELAEIRNPVTRDLIVGIVAEKLHIREEHIQAQLRYNLRKRREGDRSVTPTGQANRPTVKLLTAVDKAEYEILRILLTRTASLPELITQWLTAANFQHSVLKSLAQYLFRALQAGAVPDPKEIFNESWTEEQRFYLARLILDAEVPEYSANYDALNTLTRDCLVAILTPEIDSQIRAVRDNLKTAEKQGQDSIALLKQLTGLQEKRRQLEQKIRS